MVKKTKSGGEDGGSEKPAGKKAPPKSGFLRDLQNYGDPDFSIYMRRAFALSMGYSQDELKKPVVGIANTFSKFNPCHRTFPDLVEAVKRGVSAAGGLPLEFPTISVHESTLAPNSMKFRNLMAMDTEEMIRAQPMDAVVMLGACDKTVPAQLMGAASAGKPAIQLIGGPQMTGRYREHRVGACTDCRRFWVEYRAGRMGETDIREVEGKLVTTAGSCAVMGTASTMAAIAESLGMTLPGTAAIPAVHADRIRAAEATGAAAVRMIRANLTPDKIITQKSIENATRVLLALGGSTNGVVHLAAIAGRVGIKLDLHRFNELSDTTPVLAAVKPVGSEFYMEDFYAAGGIGAILRELKHLLHLDCMTITGETLGERLASEEKHWVDRCVIRPFDDPFEPEGGLVALFGSLAPDGAIIKRSAATKSLFEKTGRAVLFSGLADMNDRVDDPDLDVTEDDFLVLQNVGPASPAAMPEAGFLPIPKKLLQKGIKDMVRMSDARMSGTAYGTIILHIAPEAHVGGPLAFVKSGDRIKLSVKERRLDLLVDDAEIARRRKEWEKRTVPMPDRGYDRLFRESVLQAPDGCDFRFLRKE
jgi:dihydroxy-acid dehydratase